MTPAELELAVAAIPAETLKAAALARVDQAMQHIQRAQDEMDRACEMLSPLCYAAPVYSKAQAIRERVHSFWYIVQNLRYAGKVRLDRCNVEALAVRIAERAARGPDQSGVQTLIAEAERLGITVTP